MRPRHMSHCWCDHLVHTDEYGQRGYPGEEWTSSQGGAAVLCNILWISFGEISSCRWSRTDREGMCYQSVFSQTIVHWGHTSENAAEAQWA